MRVRDSSWLCLRFPLPCARVAVTELMMCRHQCGGRTHAARCASSWCSPTPARPSTAASPWSSCPWTRPACESSARSTSSATTMRPTATPRCALVVPHCVRQRRDLMRRRRRRRRDRLSFATCACLRRASYSARAAASRSPRVRAHAFALPSGAAGSERSCQGAWVPAASTTACEPSAWLSGWAALPAGCRQGRPERAWRSLRRWACAGSAGHDAQSAYAHGIRVRVGGAVCLQLTAVLCVCAKGPHRPAGLHPR
jgi:hypothetical protein